METSYELKWVYDRARVRSYPNIDTRTMVKRKQVSSTAGGVGTDPALQRCRVGRQSTSAALPE